MFFGRTQTQTAIFSSFNFNTWCYNMFQNHIKTVILEILQYKLRVKTDKVISLAENFVCNPQHPGGYVRTLLFIPSLLDVHDDGGHNQGHTIKRHHHE